MVAGGRVAAVPPMPRRSRRRRGDVELPDTAMALGWDEITPFVRDKDFDFAERTVGDSGRRQAKTLDDT